MRRAILASRLSESEACWYRNCGGRRDVAGAAHHLSERGAGLSRQRQTRAAQVMEVQLLDALERRDS